MTIALVDSLKMSEPSPAEIYLRKQTEQMARVAAGNLEMIIMAGCSRCGRRLVENSLPIHGAALVNSSVFDALVNGRKPEALCAECLSG